MSGVYLTVWDDDCQFDRILQPTVGGWPHVTLAWTGKNLTHDELRTVGVKAFQEWTMKQITLSQSMVNTFFHHGENKNRHDVLLIVDEYDEVEKSRQRLLVEAFPETYEKFHMMKPHVTAKTFWTLEEAEAYHEELSEKLPITVTVTGVCID